MELRADSRDVTTEHIDDRHHRPAQQQRGQMARQTNTEARPDDQRTQRHNPDGGVAQVGRRQRHKQRPHFLQVVLRYVGHLQAEEIFDLHGSDGNTNPRGEPQRHGKGNIFNQATKAGQTKQNQKYARHQGGDQQACQTKLLRNRVEDHHEGGGRAGDAEARTARQGNDDPGNGRGVQTVLRRNAAANCQRHRQRDGDDADGDPGNQVTDKA